MSNTVKPWFYIFISELVFQIKCFDKSLFCLRFWALQPDGYFYASHTRPTGWTHIVLNYIGSNDGQGIRIYFDEVEVASDTTKDRRPYSIGDGRIVVGRQYTDRDAMYMSVQVDELIFFNQSLSNTDINALYKL